MNFSAVPPIRGTALLQLTNLTFRNMKHKFSMAIKPFITKPVEPTTQVPSSTSKKPTKKAKKKKSE